MNLSEHPLHSDIVVRSLERWKNSNIMAIKEHIFSKTENNRQANQSYSYRLPIAI